MPLPPASRRVFVAATVTLSSVVGCRATDETRVARPPVVTAATSRAASVEVNRIPGGRPAGLGDPRRESHAPLQRGRTADPVGSYDLAFIDDGKPMTGTMVIEGTPGTYSGRINAQARPEVQISTVTASGPLVTVTADVPNGVLLLRFRMTADSLHGDWSLRGDGGRLSGARRRTDGGKR